MIQKNDIVDLGLAKTLGMVGSALGIVAAMFKFLLFMMNRAIGSVGELFGVDATDNSILTASIFAQFLCVATLILSYLIHKNPKVFGILLVIGGVMNAVWLNGLGFGSGLLILIAGIVALLKASFFTNLKKKYIQNQPMNKDLG